MCYTAQCKFEGIMGECSVSPEERQLLDKEGYTLPCPDYTVDTDDTKGLELLEKSRRFIKDLRRKNNGA